MVKHKEDSLVSDKKERQLILPRLRKHFLSKKRVIIAVVVVIILGGVIIAWYFIKNPINNQKTPVQLSSKEKALKSFGIYNEASKIARSGDYAAGQASLDKAIKDASSNIDQATIYMQKAVIAINAKNYDDAYNFSKKAEGLNADVSSARTMAIAAVGKGDIKDAIAKYRLALSRITGTSELDELDKQDILASIKKLGG